MTATDRLRAMLDERGVDWVTEDDPEEPAHYFVTKWFANGCEQTYEEIPAIRSRSLEAYCVTPEQAIAATLGAETCTIGDYKDPDYGYTHDAMWNDEWFVPSGRCSGCGEYIPVWNYCPNCGKKVVDE